MTSKSDDTAISKVEIEENPLSKKANAARNRARNLRESVKEIGLALAIVHGKVKDKNNNQKTDDDASVVEQKPVRAIARSLSYPWAYDVMDIVMNDANKSFLRMHYQRCPWFYDTANECVSLPIYGKSQHEFVKTYYEAPELWNSVNVDKNERPKSVLDFDLLKKYPVKFCVSAGANYNGIDRM